MAALGIDYKTLGVRGSELRAENNGGDRALGFRLGMDRTGPRSSGGVNRRKFTRVWRPREHTLKHIFFL